MHSLTPPHTTVSRFKYDSVHRTWPGIVEAKQGGLVIDGHTIKGSSMSDPGQIPWADAGVDYGGSGDGGMVKCKREGGKGVCCVGNELSKFFAICVHACMQRSPQNQNLACC